MSRSQQKQLFRVEAPQAPMPWETAAAADRLAAQVVFNLPLDATYDYLIPDELREAVGPGQRVKVPFGAGDRAAVGYCVGIGIPEAGRRLKSISALIDREALITPQMLELTHWIADRYLCGWGQVLHSIIPAGVKRKSGTRIVSFYELAPGVRERLEELRLPAKQRAVLQALCASDAPLGIDDLATAADCGTGPIGTLRKKGLIRAVRRRTEQFAAELGPITAEQDLELNRDQQLALAQILATLRAGQHRTILLHGVTGSGKTEVYIQAIREVVSYGRQAIVLVPEISLTPQTIRRFRSRFDSVAVLHSHLSDAERHWHWQQIADGSVQVVVGARSAVFAPTPRLGLIVIDEEHETSFKQETTPRYHAREVARRRCELESVPLVLGSATPTLESWQRVQQKKDTLLTLPKRVRERPLPPVVIVDLRNDPQCTRGAAIGRALQTAMQAAINDHGQVILFQNLRGFSPTIWCRSCGEPVRCPACDISLTYHRDRNIALCHFCDFQQGVPRECPKCTRPGMRYLGIGTQKLEDEVRLKFPDVRCLRMDSDSMRRPGSHDAALEAFRAGDVRILLGTQMIAKGLDFPNVTLVGVIDADTMLHQPDLRASERTFQLLSQVAGRTGRGQRGGRVLVQTSSPAEPAVVKAAEHDFRGFMQAEMAHRQQMLAPPFYHLTRVILRGPREDLVRSQSVKMADAFREWIAKAGVEIRVLGAAPAPVARLKNHYRYHIQLTAKDRTTVQALWRAVSADLPRTADVEYVIDVDPMNLR